MYFTKTIILLAAAASSVLALPLELDTRGSTTVDPNAITGTKCGSSANILFHDSNVAQLQICGGIAGAITKCGGNPSSTTGASGTAKYTLTAPSGATINVSKGRWEGCVRAGIAACPNAEFTSTCLGGVTSGTGFTFSLSAQ